ncbi:conjugal transfer protein TraI [Dinghuibacter silviterrae]|uniref:Conjugal transfer protein TraI n=1 Tax=Dinghuibacter silviterrae TaxID=1539049 RepID=A0A4R8DHB0_9BACT|nr:conjugal transfer protein TraI [Dinghuibacter silviterrae]TDW97101.1 hypothetical protein EDB95_4942 [Dinghuibacter silviterrae]
MNRYKKWSVFILLIGLALAPTQRSQAQIDIIGDALKAIIKAIDLKVQQLQNATIDLQNAQKAVENELSKLQLGQIGDWEQQFKDLYGQYFDELWKVKTVISYLRQVTGIIAQQQELMREYKQDWALIQQDPHFSTAELSHIHDLYSGVVGQSVKSLDQILLILQSFSLQMSDADRMKIIAGASNDISRQTSDLRQFSNRNIQLSLQRAKDADDLNTISSLYGITQ